MTQPISVPVMSILELMLLPYSLWGIPGSPLTIGYNLVLCHSPHLIVTFVFTSGPALSKYIKFIILLVSLQARAGSGMVTRAKNRIICCVYRW